MSQGAACLYQASGDLSANVQSSARQSAPASWRFSRSIGPGSRQKQDEAGVRNRVHPAPLMLAQRDTTLKCGRTVSLQQSPVSTFKGHLPMTESGHCSAWCVAMHSDSISLTVPRSFVRKPYFLLWLSSRGARISLEAAAGLLPSPPRTTGDLIVLERAERLVSPA